MNTQTSTELWERIRTYEIDDQSSIFPYSRKLAAENGWSHQFALRVVEEYRKFAYLAMVAEHTVSPSDAVDQAWHLHQLYSREYWGHFCPQILGVPFHHGPSMGGEEENSKFEHLYEQTKLSYLRIFQVEPPEDIWPATHKQFSERHVRVNTSDFLVISRNRFPFICRAVVLILNVVLKLSKGVWPGPQIFDTNLV